MLVLTHRPATALHGERFFACSASDALSRLSGCRHVYVNGGAVIRQFIEAKLLDAIIVSLVPVLLGDGLPL